MLVGFLISLPACVVFFSSLARVRVESLEVVVVGNPDIIIERGCKGSSLTSSPFPEQLWRQVFYVSFDGSASQHVRIRSDSTV